MLPIDDILDALDLSRAQPGIGFLEALFARFNARVPFESASKILRDAEVADPREKPRAPEIFWSDHLALGTGGTCFARVTAFDALLSALGFSTRRVFGRVERDGDHAALLISTPRGEVIADVGFPLPVLLPVRPGIVETALADLSIEATEWGFHVRWAGGAPEGPRSIDLFTAAVSDEDYLARWRDTFRPGSRFLRRVVLRRNLDNRVVRYAGGEVTVDDRHSRLRVPLPSPRHAALAEIFGVDADTLDRAFRIAPDPPPPDSDAVLTAYLAASAPAEEAFSRIATPAGYARLLEGVAGSVAADAIDGGFRVTLSAPDSRGAGASILEEVEVDGAARSLTVRRRAGDSTFVSSYGAEDRGGETFLRREVRLAGRREDLLRNDSLRGRLAGTLAVDLLAWARMVARPGGS